MHSPTPLGLASAFLALSAGAAASPAELFEKRGCGNNCARAVIASNFPERPTKADCSSYLAVTVTPPTATYTAVQTNTETIVLSITVTQDSPVDKRTVKPIPTYASACKNEAAYVEACGCIGVSAHTVTAPTPSVEVTATEVATETVTVATTVTPEPTAPAPRIIVNGEFEAPLEGTWKSAVLEAPIMAIDGPGPFVAPPPPGASGVSSLNIRYLNGDPQYEARRGVVKLSQQVTVEPNTAYELSMWWMFDAVQDVWCEWWLQWTPDTTTDFPPRTSDYPAAYQANDFTRGHTWIQGKTLSFAPVVVPDGVDRGTVVLEVACAGLGTIDSNMWFDEIVMAKV